MVTGEPVSNSALIALHHAGTQFSVSLGISSQLLIPHNVASLFAATRDSSTSAS